MPWGLRRFQESRQLHFVTFSCYRRRPLLDVANRRLGLGGDGEGLSGDRFFGL